MERFEWRLEDRDSFYETLVEWWIDWGFPVMEKKALPVRIFVVSTKRDDTYIDLYAVPMFISDSDLCWLGYPTSNKQASSGEKEGALDFIMEKIETSMKYHGYGRIITTSFTPKLMDLFSRRDYVLADEKTNYYTKIL